MSLDYLSLFSLLRIIQSLDIKIKKLVGSKVFIEDNFEMDYFWFEAEIVEGKLKIMEPHNFDKFKYFSSQEMHKQYQELSPNTQNYINTNNR